MACPRTSLLSPLACSALVFGLTLLVFSRSVGFDLVNWDDLTRVAENQSIRRLDHGSLYHIFTTFTISNYTPVEQLSYALDYLVWGLDPAGFHLTNVILHGLNASLILVLALQLLGWNSPPENGPASQAGEEARARLLGATCAALIFALHPLRVESVVWVSERRDVLALFWLLLGVLAHLASVRAAAGSRRRDGWRLGAWLLFAGSLLSKASGVTLPVVLLLLDVYPLRRMTLSPQGMRSVGVCLIEKLPFLALAFAAGLIAVWGQSRQGAMIDVGTYPLASRVANSLVALVFYIEKWLAPWPLFPIYSRAPHHLAFFRPVVLMSAAWLVLVTVGLVGLRKRWPGGAVAWLSFVIMILPFTGLLQAGNAMAADRYTYLSMIPLAVMAGAIFGRGMVLSRSCAAKAMAGAGVAILLSVWSCLTARQVLVWKDSKTLWERVLQEVPHEFVPLGNYSSVLISERQYYLARVMAREALRCNSRSDVAWHNLGVAAALCGQTDEARGAFGEAVRLNPAAGDSHFELAKLLHRQGLLEEARVHYFAAVQDVPTNERLTNLAVALDDAGHPAPAIKFLAQAAMNGDSTAYLVWATILVRHAEPGQARALLALGYRFTGDPLLRALQREVDQQMRAPPETGRDDKKDRPRSPNQRSSRR